MFCRRPCTCRYEACSCCLFDFFQRAVDQVFVDVALQKVPVIFCIDRAGIVGEDGVTHQGVFDIPLLRSVPGIVMMAPQDGAELESMLEFALSLDVPSVIRYPKSAVPLTMATCSPLKLGEAQLLRTGRNYCIIALGSMVSPALAADDILRKDGICGTCVNARFVKPLDAEFLKKIIMQSCQGAPVFTVEDGVIDAGFGSAVCDGLGFMVERLGLPAKFIEHGKRQFLLEKYGLDAAGIAQRIKKALKKMARVEIDYQRCKGCYLCIGACPKGCLVVATSLNKRGCKPVSFKPQATCSGCCQCAIMCPDCCIEIIKE